MSNIVELFKEFKSDREKQEFIAAQQATIEALLKSNTALKDEVEHLKALLLGSTQLLNEPKVERIILSPEEALIERQIAFIQARGVNSEVTLEDVKKLDLLLKNKHLSKEKSETFSGESRKPDRKNLSSKDLIQIALKKPDNEG